MATFRAWEAEEGPTRGTEKERPEEEGMRGVWSHQLQASPQILLFQMRGIRSSDSWAWISVCFYRINPRGRNSRSKGTALTILTGPANSLDTA